MRRIYVCAVKYDKGGIMSSLLLKTVYCRGSGLELLSAFLSLAVCHDSNVKWHRKFPS